MIGFAGADGRQLWRQVVNGSADQRDEAYAVVGYGTGAVAAGYLKNLDTGRDFAVISFCGQCGENWRQVIDTGGNEVADAVAVDGNGDVLAGGTFTAIKFRGSDGAELWRQVVDQTFANAIAVDALGNVIAVGSNGDGDFTVIKLRGTDGGDF